jgi:triosephosphate isomerase (TIM)
MIILNLKIYPESIGDNLINIVNNLSNLIDDFPKYRENLLIAPNHFQLSQVKSQYSNLNFAAQSIENLDLGAFTGHLSAEILKSINIKYTIINHSESRCYDKNINNTIIKIEKLGIKTIVCCENLLEAEYILKAKPFAIAYETKELIGSGKSVANENPEIVKDFIKLINGKNKAIIGAGISNAEDIRVGRELGADGYILASAFVKANNHYQKALELLQAY